MRVGYLGPEGTYTWQMAQRLFPHEELVSFSPVGRVVRAVEKGIVDRAVVPFENIKECPVFQMLDPLARMDHTHLIGEAWMPIVHALGALQETTLAQVRTLYSHPQALAQCAEALDTLLSENYDIVETGSTAGAAGTIQNQRLRNAAAIANVPALHKEGLAVLVDNLVPGNRTRFGVLSITPCEVFSTESLRYKTLLSISGLPDFPGALDDFVLMPLRKRGINKVYIQSRPQGNTAYRFLIELETHAKNPCFTAAYKDMQVLFGPQHQKQFTRGFKILGTYLDSKWKEGLS